jgi:hypothetical protein
VGKVLVEHQQRSYDAVSETEQEGTEEVPAEAESEQDAPADEVPENVNPETGEVLEDVEPDADDAAALAEKERRDELAAERQAAEQAAAETEAQIERQGKALDRATKAYTDKLLAALGDDLGGWQPCPLCADGYPGIRMAMMPSPERLAAVKVAIGEDPDPDLPSDGYSRRCESCDGWGKVQTGSRVTTQKAAQCHDCGGAGWIAVGPERAAGNITGGNGAPAQPLAPLQDNVTNDPPEVAMLKQLGYIVVPKITPPDQSQIGA